MFHPWRALRRLGHVALDWSRPHPATPGATNGVDMIWLDPRMNQVERRCVLTHELVHLERGHTGCQPPAVEHAVRTETARRLIGLDQLLRAMPWAMSVPELADELWVTELVLLDRLRTLSEVERAAILARHEDAPQNP